MGETFSQNWAWVSEWLNLVIRWAHIVAGISWIGSSFYFMWLDASLEKPAKGADDKIIGHLWMVHSGGFYHVEKRYVGAGEVPPNLHWFKWEAAFTWLTGFALLMLVYYSGGILVDEGAPTVGEGTAAVIGLALFPISWFVYDQLWMRLERNRKFGYLLSYLLLVGLTYGLTLVFGPRASYIHVGAILGTLMVLNVWVRILPAQREMIAATQAGNPRNMVLGERAKGRSVHNNYMTFPVIFIMISSHFPSTYGHAWNWLVLAALILASAGIRHHMNVNKKQTLWMVWAAIVIIVSLGYLTR